MPALIVWEPPRPLFAGVLFQSAIEREMRGPLVHRRRPGGGIDRVRRGRSDGAPTAIDERGWGRRCARHSVAQAIALIPGISARASRSPRSRARARREDATRFAFLLATPVILGAGAKTVLDARKAAELFAQPDVLAVGFVLSFSRGSRRWRSWSVSSADTRSTGSWPTRLVLAALIVVGVIAGSCRRGTSGRQIASALRTSKAVIAPRRAIATSDPPGMNALMLHGQSAGGRTNQARNEIGPFHGEISPVPWPGARGRTRSPTRSRR